jgi:hypothetical protein
VQANLKIPLDLNEARVYSCSCMDTFFVPSVGAQATKVPGRAQAKLSHPAPGDLGQSASRLLYDRKSAARQLSISIRSLDYLISAGEFETRRIGRKVLVTHKSLVKFAQGNHYASPKELAAVAA